MRSELTELMKSTENLSKYHNEHIVYLQMEIRNLSNDHTNFINALRNEAQEQDQVS